ncbi:MAG TPA: hypothetical protein VFF10_09825 [Trueperaceae bacterium]|nr:hypothetical protein [Trueperaceae bacterium]
MKHPRYSDGTPMAPADAAQVHRYRRALRAGRKAMNEVYAEHDNEWSREIQREAKAAYVEAYEAEMKES